MFKETIEEQAKQQWLNDRKEGVGGSDISTILGLNPHKSPHQLWMEKTGRSDENVDNNFTRAGVKLEPMVADWFEETTKLQLINPGNVVTKHATHDWILGTPDRETVDKELVRGILEIKTTGHAIDPDNLPLPWFCQVNWYAGIKRSYGVTDMVQNYIAWFERMTCAFNFTSLTFDPAFFQYLVDQAGIFWNTYVITDTPPPAKSAKDVALLYRTHAPGKAILATEELAQTIAELIETQKVIKNASEQADKYKLGIQLIMQDAESIIVDGRPAVTWKTAKDSLTFDETRFKSDHPDLYNSYLATSPGSRRFLVKK